MYSTATLNPLSLSYCIPPDSHQLLYIPVVFNNSIPDQVSYYIRSLDTGHAEVKTVAGSSMKRSRSGRPRQQSANEDDHEEDVSEPDAHPLSAMVLRSQTGEVDVAKLPSVKPSDSLALVPQDLTSSQQALFLTIDRPSVVSLKSVVDKRGDRFHITPHKEAIIVECPTGGHWMYEDKKAGQLVRKADKQKPAEVRCVGDEEIAQFQARGVGALKAGWRKKSKDSSETGMIEGIEDEVESVDQLALFRRDRISKTHTVPLRVVHDRPGVHTVSLTSVTDSMHNSCTPSGHWAEKLYNVISRPSARLDCSGPREILVGKTTTLPVIMDEAGSSVEVSYSFTSAEGQVSRKSLKASKRTESITVSEPGTYTLRDIQGPCGGNIMEPSSCLVQLVPLPTVEMQVTTLHEWYFS
jgi:nucleoporin POM152